jgi:YcaO-like protein with predicted kinase domain
VSVSIESRESQPAVGTSTERVLSTRSRSLAEVAALAEGQLERFGITRVCDVTGLDVVGIPVWHTIRPDAATGLNTVTSGKGETSEASRVSAMMEAIERACCEPAGRPRVLNSYAEMRYERFTLDPLRLVPRRGHGWTPATPLTWWPARAVRQDVEVWLPALAIFTPFPPEANLLRSHTIGLAIGNNRDEAVLHALYEVIENDCQAHAEVLGMGYRIRQETLPDPARELIERYERAAVKVTVHACVNGIGIPEFFALTEDTHAGDAMLFNGGAGCHLDPVTGVLRALTEAAQARLAVIGGSREDMAAQDYRRHASYAELRDRLNLWSQGRPWRSFSDFPSRSTGTVAGDLDRVLDALSRDGLGLALAAELAPADCPFSVVKVVVPGTELTHYDADRVGVRLRKARQAMADADRGEAA